jgi:hypothetical protein
MEILLRKITEKLLLKKSYVVFENELSRVWPEKGKDKEKRNAAIQAFAAANGLSAAINDPGIRVTFRKL